MFNHEPAEHDCPFCVLADRPGQRRQRAERRGPSARDALALVTPRWWPNNHGHVLVIPVRHHEDLYDLPTHIGHAVHDLTRAIAVAPRTA
jgi:histidine triad (HIT) family protein